MNQKLIFSIMITSVVFVAHYFSSFLEKMVVAGDKFAYIYLFVWYVAWIYALLHFITKQYKVVN